MHQITRKWYLPATTCFSRNNGQALVVKTCRAHFICALFPMQDTDG